MAFKGLVESHDADFKEAKDSHNFLGKNAVLEAISGLFAHRQAGFTPEDFIQNAYTVLGRVKYSQNHQIHQQLVSAGVSPDVRFLNPQLDSVTKFKRSLAERVMSFCHGAWIVLQYSLDPIAQRAEIKSAMTQIFELADQFIAKTIAQKDFGQNPQAFKEYIENEFGGFLKNVARQVIRAKGVELSNKANKKVIKGILKDLIIAERLANWERRSIHPVATIIEENSRVYVSVDSPVHTPTAAQRRELDRIQSNDLPFWFQRFSPMEKNWWLKKVELIKDGKLASPPSTYRSSPLASNFTKYSSFIFRDNHLVSREDGLRRSTVPPIDIHSKTSPKTKKERQRLAAMIAEQVFEQADSKNTLDAFWNEDVQRKLRIEALHVDQSLLTPIAGLDRFPVFENNRRMMNENAKAFHSVAQSQAGEQNPFVILTTNWPINSERGLAGRDNCFKYSENIKTKKQLETLYAEVCKIIFGQLPDYAAVTPFKNGNIDDSKFPNFMVWLADQQQSWKDNFAKNEQEAKINKFFIGFNALFDLDKLWKDCQGRNDSKHYYKYSKHNIELFAAGLTELIVNGIGGTISGGCKSAKDRKGAQVVQVVSMEQFYEKYHRLPRYTDEGNDRENFVTMFDARRYDHQKAIAGDNSYGCDACLDGRSKHSKDFMFSKKPQPMLATDIQVAMGKDQLTSQVLLGKLNKPQIDLDESLSAKTILGTPWQQKLATIQNSRLAEILQRNDSQYLYALDEATIRKLNALIWVETPVIESFSDPGPRVERRSELKQTTKPIAIESVKIQLRDDSKLQVSGHTLERKLESKVHLDDSDNEKRQLKKILEFLSESDLDSIQQNNIHLREIYRRVQANNPTLSPLALQELTSYEAKAETYREKTFNALLSKHHQIVNDLALLNSPLPQINNIPAIIKKYQADRDYASKWQGILKELIQNNIDLFGASERFIESKAQKADEVAKNPNKKAAGQQIEALKMIFIFPDKAGEFLAEKGAILLQPKAIELLNNRHILLDRAIAALKRDENPTLFKNEQVAIKNLIAGLQKAISKQEVIKKKIANIAIKQAEVCRACLIVLTKDVEFLDKLRLVVAELPKLQLMLKHANNFASIESIKNRIERLDSYLKEMGNYFSPDYQISIRNLIQQLENNINELEFIDPENLQLSSAKILLAKLKAPIDLSVNHLQSWEQVGGLEEQWNKVFRRFVPLKAQFKEKFEIAENRLYSQSSYAAQNKFPPPVERETKSGSSLEDKENRRNAHEEYIKDVNIFDKQLKDFQKHVETELAKAKIAPEEKLKNKAVFYFGLQQKLIAEANQEYDNPVVLNTKLTLKQAIVELNAVATKLKQQVDEYSAKHEALKDKMSESRVTLKEPKNKAIELANIQNSIHKRKKAIIQVLVGYDQLRHQYKQLYLKNILINPVMLSLLDKYPDIFSDDLLKQQAQVEFFNRAVFEGFSASEMKKFLEKEKLEIVISPEDFAKIAQFNQLSEIFSQEFHDPQKLMQLLHEKNLISSSDIGLVQNFLNVDKNTPAIQERLNARPQLLIAKKKLQDLRRLFTEAHPYDATTLDRRFKTLLSKRDYFNHQPEISNPAEYMKQLSELTEVILSLRSFDYQENLNVLDQLQSLFEKIPNAEQQILETNELLKDILSAQEFTAVPVSEATAIYTHKLKDFFKILIEKLQNMDLELYKEHYSLLRPGRKIEDETNHAQVSKYISKAISIQDRTSDFQQLLSQCAETLRHFPALPLDSPVRAHFDQLARLLTEISPKVTDRLAMYTGDNGRIVTAQNRLEAIEKFSSLHHALDQKLTAMDEQVLQDAKAEEEELHRDELNQLSIIDKEINKYRSVADKIDVMVDTAVAFARNNDYNLLRFLSDILIAKDPRAKYQEILQQEEVTLGLGKNAIAKYLRNIADKLADFPHREFFDDIQVRLDTLNLDPVTETLEQRDALEQLKNVHSAIHVGGHYGRHVGRPVVDEIRNLFAQNDLMIKVLLAPANLNLTTEQLNEMRDDLRATPSPKLPGEEKSELRLTPKRALTFKDFKAKYQGLPLSETIYNKLRAVEQVAELKGVVNDFEKLESEIMTANAEMSHLSSLFKILDSSRERRLLRQAKTRTANNHHEIAKMRLFISGFSANVKLYGDQRKKFNELYTLQQRLKMIAKGQNQSIPARAKKIDALLTNQQTQLKMVVQYNQSWIKYLNDQANRAIKRSNELLAAKTKDRIEEASHEVKDHLDHLNNLISLLPSFENEQDYQLLLEQLMELNISESIARTLLDRYSQIKEQVGDLEERAANLEIELITEELEHPMEPLRIIALEDIAHEAKRVTSRVSLPESKDQKHVEKVPLLDSTVEESVDFKLMSNETKNESKTLSKQEIRETKIEPRNSKQGQIIRAEHVLRVLDTTIKKSEMAKPPESKQLGIPAETPKIELAVTRHNHQIKTDYVEKTVMGTFTRKPTYKEGKDVAQNAAVNFFKLNEKVALIRYDSERLCRKTAIWICAINETMNKLNHKNDTVTVYVEYKQGNRWITKEYNPKEQYRRFGMLRDDLGEIQKKTNAILNDKASNYSLPGVTFKSIIEQEQKSTLSPSSVQQLHI